jgi:hypothetical protein
MLRTLAFAAIALVLTANLGQAAQKKAAGSTVAGVIKKVDAATGTLTVTVTVKKEKTDKEFKVADATKFVVLSGKDKKELSSKDGLKSEELKEGASIKITTDAEGKVTEITIGKASKK